MLVVGNKKDCKNQREVDWDVLEDFGKKNNVKFMEVSAKNGEGIEKIFIIMCEELLKLKEVGIIKEEESEGNKTFTSLDNSKLSENKHNCNC